MAHRTKRRPRGPRRKRLSRPARLAAARAWLPTYGGRRIARGYARWFGVDLLCAVQELRLLGVSVSAAYEAELRRSLEERRLARQRRTVARTDGLARQADDWLVDEWLVDERGPGAPASDDCPF